MRQIYDAHYVGLVRLPGEHALGLSMLSASHHRTKIQVELSNCRTTAHDQESALRDFVPIAGQKRRRGMILLIPGVSLLSDATGGFR